MTIKKIFKICENYAKENNLEFVGKTWKKYEMRIGAFDYNRQKYVSIGFKTKPIEDNIKRKRVYIEEGAGVTNVIYDPPYPPQYGLYEAFPAQYPPSENNLREWLDELDFYKPKL